MTTAKHRPSENTPAEQNEILTSSESEPERRRRENISANLQILTELGLTQGGLVVKKNSEAEEKEEKWEIIYEIIITKSFKSVAEAQGRATSLHGMNPPKFLASITPKLVSA
ncbi:hypothetical protein BC938DRAFT_473684 [Jimgerdemannia flammicorona]|uniref:Uncharacterized protein n=1 Tax=Jimgerdemannia flammicorona TaxID=994334 RepID=A0A433QT79_9FUNG|nr:hypothetical protein BC938DRAFT_473684 [Jimgerdemannia flammicorona]